MIAMPFGNQTSSATCSLDPSGRTTATIPGFRSSHGIEPGMSTQQLPPASTTISLNGCPAAPYGASSGPATTPAWVVTTRRPSGSQSMENGSPSTRATTSRSPAAENARTSPATQSHIQNRPSCHRGDSPICIPLVAKISVMDGQTPTGDGTHRVRPARAADLTQLAAIEDAGGPQFQEYFGEAIEPILLSPATDGRQRASEPGFLLVAALDEQGPPVGFVHVLI